MSSHYDTNISEQPSRGIHDLELHAVFTLHLSLSLLEEHFNKATERQVKL